MLQSRLGYVRATEAPFKTLIIKDMHPFLIERGYCVSSDPDSSSVHT